MTPGDPPIENIDDLCTPVVPMVLRLSPAGVISAEVELLVILGSGVATNPDNRVRGI